MTLSILILSHNRPELFNKLIQRVIDMNPFEIIVNNDSDDIDESDNYILYHKKGSLNELYKFLVSKSHGSHIWFLEDDDIPLVLPELHNNSTIHRYLSSSLIIQQADINSPEFQLSQCCFKREDLNFDKISPYNCIFNDWHLAKDIKFDISNKIIFKQGYNGDNISFYKSKLFMGSKYCLTCKWAPDSMISELRNNELGITKRCV